MYFLPVASTLKSMSIVFSNIRISFLKDTLFSTKLLSGPVLLKFLSVFINFSGKHLCWSLQLYQKGTPTQVFFCENYEIFDNAYFEEHLRTAAPDICQFEQKF